MPPAAVVVISWLVPGAGHLMQGRQQKGVVFLVALAVAVPLRHHTPAQVLVAVVSWMLGRTEMTAMAGAPVAEAATVDEASAAAAAPATNILPWIIT